MGVEVVGEVQDALGKQGHLVRGAAGIAFVQLVVFEVDFFGAYVGSGGSQR